MNPTERSIELELTPRPKLKQRMSHFVDLAARRMSQRDAAWHFLTTGEGDEPAQAKPPWGKIWDRDYNPMPYPEARPVDPMFYEGTGIGHLYGIDLSSQMAWTLAGWNLVRTGSEQRKRRKK